MAYPNYMAQNPYYQQNGMFNNSHPNYFTNALQQAYTPQQPQNQQTITTQPPIMQPQGNVTRISPVANREEATVAPIDLINGTPSYFINKSNGEIYYKQFDVPTGSYIFKTYAEIPVIDEQPTKDKPNPYEKELHYIREGVEGLYRMLAQIQQNQQYPVSIKEVNTETIDIDTDENENKNLKSKKRGQ